MAVSGTLVEDVSAWCPGVEALSAVSVCGLQQRKQARCGLINIIQTAAPA